VLFVSPGTLSPVEEEEAVSVEAQPFNAQTAAIRIARIEVYFIDEAKT
jgi:hypothetical protein